MDMHQLTKDPERFVYPGEDSVTASIHQHNFSPFLLERYLDYCAELLAMLGKVSALYAQNTSDSVVLSSVSEIERLTNDLSSKIWQKIAILDQVVSRDHHLQQRTESQVRKQEVAP